MSTAELHLRDEDETTVTQGDLPEQGGSATPTIMPGIHMFRLPATLPQCWGTFDVKKKDANGNVLQVAGPDGAMVDQVEQHLMLKFDKDNPLIVLDPGGMLDGLPTGTVTVNTMGRKRGKRDNPDAPIVSDMTYLKVKCLQDSSVITKRKDWIPVMNKHAGKVIRLEHGLHAQCDPERVRYITDPNDPIRGVKDPSNMGGCGKRYYTQDFRVEGGGFSDTILCECGARVRGFFSIERFLEPVGGSQQA